MTQTAVDWLFNRLQTEPFLTVEDFYIAKELEKQQHGNTWDAAVESANNRTVKERAICDFDNYYSETYETESK